MSFNIKNIVKDNIVVFNSFRANTFYYNVSINTDESAFPVPYTFPIPLDDVDGATMKLHDKAIYFMRWIRKAIDDGTFLKHEYD